MNTLIAHIMYGNLVCKKVNEQTTGFFFFRFAREHNLIKIPFWNRFQTLEPTLLSCAGSVFSLVCSVERVVPVDEPLGHGIMAFN